MSVRDRWHLSRPPEGAKRCGKHRKTPSAEHGQGRQWQVEGLDGRGHVIRRNYEFEADALAFDAELKASVRAGRYVDERAGKATLRSRCELWLTTRDHDPVTSERCETAFRCHVYEDEATPGTTPRGGLAIGETPIGLLARRPSTLGAWLARLPLHPNSRCLLYDLLSSVFEDAVHDHIIIESPFGTAVKRPRRKDTDVIAWPAETLATVAGWLPAYAGAMPLLAGTCGHRQGEAFAVARDDLDMRRRVCRVQVQVKMVGNRLVYGPIKNDRGRAVPLAGYVADVLAAHMGMFPPVPVTLPWSEKNSRRNGQPVTRELLFVRPDGEPWTRSAFNPYWRRAWRLAGVEAAEQINGFHVCRHSAASAWLSGGLNVAKVAAYLGDTVAVVSKTYAHFLPADDDRARAIMEAHVKPLAGRSNSLIPSSDPPGQ